jgi:SAM-dependent methyltransferase
MEGSPMSTPQRDLWISGDRYEPYIGRWSRLVAREFIDWLAVSPGGRWIDVGCGTGALAQTVLERAAPAYVFGIDPSEGFLANARRYITDPRAHFEIAGAEALPVADDSFDAVIAGLVINFVPNQAQAALELRRALKPGGRVGAYVWDSAGEMPMMRRFWDAAIALDPAARDREEGLRFPLCKPEPLAALFRGAGFRGVDVRAIDVPTVFENFDDYWTPFLTAQAPAPTYCMSLSEEKRAALRERLRATLPARPDGSIPLIARAFAVRGVK